MGFDLNTPLEWHEALAVNRLRAKLTKEQLAELSGISRPTLYRYEANITKPRQAHRCHLEQVLMLEVEKVRLQEESDAA